MVGFLVRICPPLCTTGVSVIPYCVHLLFDIPSKSDPVVDSSDIFCLSQGTHFWCAGSYHKIHTYQMADKCSDSVVSMDLENSAFVTSNFDCNNCVTYCLDDCIVAVRIVGESVAYCYCAR